MSEKQGIFKEDEVRAILKGEEMLINTRKLRSLNACEREVNEVKAIWMIILTTIQNTALSNVISQPTKAHVMRRMIG